MLFKGAFCKFLCSASSCANTTSVFGFYTDTYWNGCMHEVCLYCCLLTTFTSVLSCYLSTIFHYHPLSFVESVSAILHMLLIALVHDWLLQFTGLCEFSLCSGWVGCILQCGSCDHHVFMLGTRCPNIYSQSVVWELQIVEVCLMILARNVCLTFYVSF